jgi:acyl transferase domain-containing protein
MQPREILADLRRGAMTVAQARAALARTGQADAATPATPPPSAAPAGSAVAEQGPGRARAVAVVGMSGRYPGAENLDEFWANLRAGEVSVGPMPPDRWDAARMRERADRRGIAEPLPAMGALRDVAGFDHEFFHIGADEARAMDPQQRLFLQEAFRALEDAGHPGVTLRRRRCGVYLGMSGQEYGWLLAQHRPDALDVTGRNAAIAAARIAYHLDMTGASMSIDTACSSSLVAIHLACQALAAGEIDMALAGGVSLYLGPDSVLDMAAAGMLSDTGRCRPFDDAADGFVPGEGVGAVVMRRLEDAERDGDPVHGVIVGSGVNQNGNTNGITAPSRRGQVELVASVYARWGLDPSRVSYVEAHATGTLLGDYMEVAARGEVLGQRPNRPVIGSLKGNIGHPSAAAGVAGLHKVLLSMRHGELVPTAGHTRPSRHLASLEHPVRILTEHEPWPSPERVPRYAAVTALGFSGSNAHLVVSEPPHQPEHTGGPEEQLFVLSARTEGQLSRRAGQLGEFLAAHPDVDLASIAHTLRTGRDAMPARWAFVGASRSELRAALDRRAGGDGTTGTNPGTPSGSAELARLAEAWRLGADIPARTWTGAPPRRLHLPGYPFASPRHWYADRSAGRAVYAADEAYLRDHRVEGRPTLIGMTFPALAADWFLAGDARSGAVRISRLRFLRPAAPGPGETVEIEIAPAGEDRPGGGTPFEARFRTAGGAWQVAAAGRLSGTEGGPARPEPVPAEGSSVNLDALYASNPAVALGPSFRTFVELGTDGRRAAGVVDAAAAIGDDPRRYTHHPLLLFSAFEAALLFSGAGNGGGTGCLPIGADEVVLRREPVVGRVTLVVTPTRTGPDVVVFDAVLTDQAGESVAVMRGCTLARLRPANGRHLGESPSGEGEVTPPGSGAGAPTGSGPVAADSSAVAYVTAAAAAILGVEAHAVPLRTNLMDLGASSDQLLALTARIERDLGMDLNPALLFEYPNVELLAGFLDREHTGVLGGVPVERSSLVPDRPPVVVPAPRSPTDVGSREEDVAIIGMHARSAAGEDLETFWRHLVEGTDLITEVPRDHWDHRPWFDPDPEAPDATYCKWGSFLPDVDAFDAEFFHVSRREAEWMDPQLRLLLQSVYAAAEDAGAIARLRGTDTGVFVGVCCHDYLDLITDRGQQSEPYAGLGNNQTVLANRVSFALDLRGPSVAVDTACSSSLVALHQARQSLLRGECGMAFVGGVNLLLSSRHYRYFSKLGALSPTGRCHTFAATADGYVPGEFVGSVLLKPLCAAEADGDRIHAVLAGSAVRHGGYTPSFTAPSVAGEMAAVDSAWRDADVAPEAIGYVEAHGTGTKLGDPIELRALSEAFRRHTGRERFCAVGSVKANLGHTEGAAGLAGLVRAVLQIQHGVIAGLPEVEPPNPLIDWRRTALYRAERNYTWETPDGRPRCAGISSFGMSGSYAHVVVREHRGAPAPPTGAAGGPVAVVLSARDTGRLRDMAGRLAGALGGFTDLDLPDIAYTLQLGREAMPERLAVVTARIDELREVLGNVAAGRQDLRALAAGRTSVAEPAGSLVTDWLDGRDIDWSTLYTGRAPRLRTLPTYPFARERFWLPDPGPADPAPGGRTSGGLASGGVAAEPVTGAPDRTEQDEVQRHPLLAGTLAAGGGHTMVLRAEEFYLADHRVAGRRIFPGVGYLEAAAAAARLSARRVRPDRPVPAVRLEDVVWLAPLEVGGGQSRCVELRLDPWDGDTAAFRVLDADGTAFCQGTVVLNPAGAEAPRVEVRAASSAPGVTVLTAEECYARHTAGGIDYGPGMRGIREVRVGHGYALARLELPDKLVTGFDAYLLHPTLLDSALQASVGLLLPGDPAASGPMLPYAVDAVEIFGQCRPAMWAVLRPRAEGTAPAAVRKFDVELCNDDGVVTVRITGAASRARRVPDQPVSTEPVAAVPVWRAVSLGPPARAGRVLVLGADAATRGLVAASWPGARELDLPADTGVDELRRLLLAEGDLDELVWAAPAAGSAGWDALLDGQRAGTLQVLRLARALLDLGCDDRRPPWTVVTFSACPAGRGDEVDPTHAGVHGLIGALAGEYPDWELRAVDLPAERDWEPGDLPRLPWNGRESVVWRGEWYTRALVPLALPRHHGGPGAGTGYRYGGVYVVVGGAGGLGEVWSEYVIRHYGAQVVWVGRRRLDERIERTIRRLAKLGSAPDYLSADAGDPSQLRRVRELVEARYGPVNGLVHAAIVLADRTVAGMSDELFAAGYDAKVRTATALARVFEGVPLDLVLFFSSIVSFTRSAGQANYAAGSVFVDALAHRLATRLRHPVKVVNWGYWGEVGVVADASYRERMAREGLGSVRASDAMAALELLLTSPVDQLAFLEADPGRVAFLDPSPGLTLYQDPSSPAGRGDVASVRARLRELANAQIGGGIEASDDDRELVHYGFDPAGLTELAARISAEYRVNLRQASFIDHPTLPRLADHLVRTAAPAGPGGPR